MSAPISTFLRAPGGRTLRESQGTLSSRREGSRLCSALRAGVRLPGQPFCKVAGLTTVSTENPTVFLISALTGGRLSSPAFPQASGTKYVSATRFMPLFFGVIAPNDPMSLFFYANAGYRSETRCSPAGVSPLWVPVRGEIIADRSEVRIERLFCSCQWAIARRNDSHGVNVLRSLSPTLRSVTGQGESASWQTSR